MPTPNSIFCFLERPMLEDGGASGSAVGEEVEVSEGFARFIDEETVCDFDAEDDETDACEEVVYEVANEVDSLVRSLDAVDADTSLLSVGVLVAGSSVVEADTVTVAVLSLIHI